MGYVRLNAVSADSIDTTSATFLHHNQSFAPVGESLN